MSEELIIRHCSPTLAGMKTGSLFSCPYKTRKQLTEEICLLNKKLVPKGLRVLPLRAHHHRALIYLYRPNALQRDLMDNHARNILEDNGYTPEKSGQCVIRLIQRLNSEPEFPHEIGLFLSYPPEDVLGFIQNKACRYKSFGCWKVYGDEAAAKSVFKKYEQCTRIYRLLWKKGNSIERLTVAG